MSSGMPLLPRPSTKRWQPLRSGLVNLFKFDREEFQFEQGRLVLRGNNGSGKSRVLALQLPFLFDGDTSPHRVEPDGDLGKRFEWNLLMGKYQDRTGYTWIEFGRVEEDGSEHFQTLGCGLKALEGRGLTDRWFFVTSRRVGAALSLVAESGIPLSRERLQESFAGDGRVFRTASEYRVAVDEALFRLGSYRYEALVNLLIQLRKPQLSREFNEAFLSSALSEALAPLDPEALGLVAEAYRGLDEDRTQLDNFTSARKAVSIFLLEYGQYARIASRRRSQLVRATQSAYLEDQRAVRKSEEELEQSTVKLSEAVAELARLELEQSAAMERVRVLENSPEMRSAQELQQAQEMALSCAKRSSSAGAELARAQDSEAVASAKNQDAQERLDSRRSEIREQREAARSAAAKAAFDSALVPGEGAEVSALVRAHEKAQPAFETRHKAILNLEDLERKIARWEANLASAKQSLGEATQRGAAAAERVTEREQEFHANVAALEQDTRSWLGQLRRLQIPAAELVLESLLDWTGSCTGDSPSRTVMFQAQSAFREQSAFAEAAFNATLAGLALRRTEWEQERKEFEAGLHIGPVARAGIHEQRRRKAPGAPFWRLIDFAPGVPEVIRAGIEAGLEAAGILDAWVTPEGRMLSASDEDTILDATTEFAGTGADGAGLTCWLRGAVDRESEQDNAISDSLIQRLLQRIGTQPGSATAWIAEDGSWQLGCVRGKWSKPEAQHIGQGARKAERRRRLLALEQERIELELKAAQVEAALENLRQAKFEADAEASGLPSASACVEAAHRLIMARDALLQSNLQVQEAERRVFRCREESENERRQYELTAEAFGLSGWSGRLRELQEYCSRFNQEILKLASSGALLGEAQEGSANAAATHRRAMELRERSEQAHLQAKEEAATTDARRLELEASIGSTVEGVLARLTIAKRQASELNAQIREKSKVREEAGNECVRLEERVSLLGKQLGEKAAQREIAIAALRSFAATGLLHTALPDLEPEVEGLSTSTWVEIARQAESALGSVDSGDPAWERSSRAIFAHFTNLQTSLGALSYRPEGTNEADFFVVRVPFQQRICTIDEIQRIFTAEVEARERILEARERDIIENHLIGEISNFIHDRLHAAEEWVSLVNRELNERPTSTGMKLRFDWILNEEGPSGFPEARRRLMRAAVSWTEDDRAMVADFLYQKLQSERSANPQKTWLENLSHGFDYRAWHRFVVERQQDGRWQRLTKRTFGTGSGGEKALVLTMPQFAAAAAHYRSADPLAPRLILLDEAFVGIDNENRANALGLLHYFDLDVVMTSEREWACYPTVPGIAIYQLAVRPGVDAILATRWIWDGSKRYRAELPENQLH